MASSSCLGEQIDRLFESTFSTGHLGAIADHDGGCQSTILPQKPGGLLEGRIGVLQVVLDEMTFAEGIQCVGANRVIGHQGHDHPIQVLQRLPDLSLHLANVAEVQIDANREIGGPGLDQLATGDLTTFDGFIQKSGFASGMHRRHQRSCRFDIVTGGPGPLPRVQSGDDRLVMPTEIGQCGRDGSKHPRAGRVVVEGLQHRVTHFDRSGRITPDEFFKILDEGAASGFRAKRGATLRRIRVQEVFESRRLRLVHGTSIVPMTISPASRRKTRS